MFPGLVSKRSEQALALATTISPKADIVRITDTTVTTVLATITPPYAGFSGQITFINASGANITTVTTGNIIVARTIPINMPIPLTYSKIAGTWYVGAIS